MRVLRREPVQQVVAHPFHFHAVELPPEKLQPPAAAIHNQPNTRTSASGDRPADAIHGYLFDGGEGNRHPGRKLRVANPKVTCPDADAERELVALAIHETAYPEQKEHQADNHGRGKWGRFRVDLVDKPTGRDRKKQPEEEPGNLTFRPRSMAR